MYNIHANMKTIAFLVINWQCGNPCTWPYNARLLRQSIYYAYYVFVRFEHSLCRGSVMTAYILKYILILNNVVDNDKEMK